MKITIESPAPGAEDEVVLRFHNLDQNVLELVQKLQVSSDKLTVFQEEQMFQIRPQDVYYFESVDDHTFAYLKDTVYEVKLKLYELEERYAHTDFFRASKSTILNLSRVQKFAPDFNGRFEATMKNGEKQTISRQYVPQLKEKLGLKK